MKKIQDNYIMTMFIMGLILPLFYPGRVNSSETAKINNVTLKPEAQKMVGIEVINLKPQILTHFISAPGEVIPNANLTAKVTSRISAQVTKRYIQEGQRVSLNQPLAELSSVDMAKAQGDLLLASQEWERVQTLGKDAISAKRFSEAQVAYQHAYSTVQAYGMTEAEINELLLSQKTSQTQGKFKLLAPRNGTIFNINFTEGELIEPGKPLVDVVEETTVWIDANLPPDVAHPVKVGNTAQVLAESNNFVGKVIQVHHQLDETTRTRSIRLEVSNKEDLLHPGQFVNCQIESSQTLSVLAMPSEAVLRTADGDWTIYVEKKPNQFQPMEVKIIEMINDQAVIEGVAAGTRVVTKGAFFIHAELNKTGFDSH